MKGKMSFLDVIAMLFVLVGAINWGLIGFFNFNLVPLVTMNTDSITRIVYMVVGVAGLWALFKFIKCGCSKGSCE